MYHLNFSVYLGRENEQGFIGFCSENGFFVILKIDVAFTKEKGRDLLKRINTEIEQASISSLNAFETFLINKFKEADIPSSFSCAAGLVHKELIWLKTVGTGQIYLRRGRDFVKLIEGGNSASGYISAGDFFVFTTKEFAQLLGTEIQLKDVVSHHNPHEILETITPRMKKQEDEGMIALFVSFETEKVVETELSLQPPVPKQSIIGKKIASFLQNAREKVTSQERKKIWTFVGAAIILIIFIWSVIMTYQRNGGLQSQKKLETTKELINEELNQAQEVSFLNMPRAIVLIAQAKKNLADLKQVIKDPNNKDVQGLTELIREKEKQILKKEQKQTTEFFDLSVENKNATGQIMSLDGENLAVFDPNGAAYLLSLTKKSLDRRTSSDIKGALLIANYQDNIYFFKKGVGIFQLSADGKTKKVIGNDSDWKEIISLSAYNGNLYLLDRGKNQIYKYLVAENGFSQKTIYLQPGQNLNFQAANSIAIDASVYVGLPGTVIKYTSGLQDSFGLVFPEKDVEINKIFTSKDTAKVYAWDKNKGTIYVIDKSGAYERQISSSIFTKGTDFVVFNNNAYVLVGPKIYSVSLE